MIINSCLIGAISYYEFFCVFYFFLASRNSFLLCPGRTPRAPLKILIVIGYAFFCSLVISLSLYEQQQQIEKFKIRYRLWMVRGMDNFIRECECDRVPIISFFHYYYECLLLPLFLFQLKFLSRGCCSLSMHLLAPLWFTS